MLLLAGVQKQPPCSVHQPVVLCLLCNDVALSLLYSLQSAAAAPSPVLGNMPPGDGMPVGPVPPGFFQVLRVLTRDVKVEGPLLGVVNGDGVGRGSLSSCRLILKVNVILYSQLLIARADHSYIPFLCCIISYDNIKSFHLIKKEKK